MRVIPNERDVVFTVGGRPGMSETDKAADVDAVTADLAALSHARGAVTPSTSQQLPSGDPEPGGRSVTTG